MIWDLDQPVDSEKTPLPHPQSPSAVWTTLWENWGEMARLRPPLEMDI